MTWQDELRRLDTALAAGDISQSEHQEQRDAVLSIAAGSRAGSPFDTQLTLRNQPIAALSTPAQTDAQQAAAGEAATRTEAGAASISQAFAGRGTGAAGAGTSDAAGVSAAEHEHAVAPRTQPEQARIEQTRQDPAEPSPAEATTDQVTDGAPGRPGAHPTDQPGVIGRDDVTAAAVSNDPDAPAATTPAADEQLAAAAPAPSHPTSRPATTGAPGAGPTAPAPVPSTARQAGPNPGVPVPDGATEAQTLGARLGAVMQDHPNVHQTDQDALALRETDQASRPGPYAGRAEEVFSAQNARPRRKYLPIVAVAVVVLAVIAAGAFWLLSQNGPEPGDTTVPDHAQGQGDGAAPAEEAVQPDFPALPGAVAPHPEAMSRDAAVNAGVLGESEVATFADHDVSEIFFRGSVDGDNAFGVLVGVAPTADAALAAAEALARSQTELGLAAVAMEEVPAEVRVFEQVGEEQSIHRAVYVSGEYVVRIGVAGPTNGAGEPVAAAFRTLAEDTLRTLEQN
ncbi:hypothetical protein FHR81_003925 [Actinoalloteichus hoggarensis]|uniref:Uncharacterized protein n=1 Tax=Actinoalloteichus hoggarensis TaxID=1470176 RepID=A0A221VWW9_9PSEU|nr:hypothetical protein [Actinoalloteichus hoggarensis]ASO17741.1 hypothetical protein AHOG_00335 [Actinoalloteichus hoggarensis]MBB5922868.1 hypothetical protein [Actinoalloteichus hoggarensis]